MRRHLFVLGAIALAAALLPAYANTTGSVMGTVTLTTGHKAPSTTSVYGRRGVAPKPSSVAPETRKVVVYLDGVRLATPPAPTRATIVQRGEQFFPPVAVVTKGSTVDFPNEDPFFHNVFSLSRAATFDLGRYPSGTVRSQVFDRPGIVKVFCHIHAQMSALVVVLDHPWFAIPTETGEFSLPAVPPGEYTIVAWHERIGEQRRPVRVSASRVTQVHFTLPVLEDDR